MTMNTTGEPHGSYGDPPTMPLRPIPAMPGVPPQPGHAPQPTHPPAGPAGAVPTPRKPQEQPTAPASTARSGLIMALGSLASRALGFVRSAMIVAALTTGPIGDAFNVGNSLPNIVYMMLIGGALASVFVPELVQAAQTHKDGGVAYTDRLLTICGVMLVVLTVGAWLAAPAIVDLYSNYTGAQRDLTIAFARWCLPQIFFYGVFTLLGQVLNSRDRFGAMMWTPVLNNVVAIGVFGLYMVIGGEATKAEQMTSGQTMLLGLGSTLGIVIQALGLLPSLRAAKFRWRPRFDWRGSGLTKPLRAAGWALLLVIVTQLSFAVITRLSTSAGKHGEALGLPGVGNAAYNYAYQLFVVPQGVITISLVTALLPRMSRSAAARDLTAVGSDLAGMLRSSAGMIVPAAVLLVALAEQICSVAYLYGGMTPDKVQVIAQTLMAFAIGLPAFCAQYALARGFYAMGDARTPFWLTVATTLTNAGLSCVAYWLLPVRWIIVGMAGAQTVACVVSIVLTGWALGRRLRQAPPPAGAAAAYNPEATVMLGLRRGPARSGLDGGQVVTLHLAIALACVPGALAGHWIASGCASALGGGLIGNLIGLGLGSLTVLASLFLLARPLGAGASVAPLARKLRIPYPAPAAANSGKHRR
ncbi:murein biosynthesis integral membrane protein MurJ [Kitasatospora sp. McL0602]|uniref:murein biosynthesis integral membrane protein MurJ n=1 Tax=Kitasatospora sp. McL0602 TaxID=3439530 RepID=UPI003F8952B1